MGRRWWEEGGEALMAESGHEVLCYTTGDALEIRLDPLHGTEIRSGRCKAIIMPLHCECSGICSVAISAEWSVYYIAGLACSGIYESTLYVSYTETNSSCGDLSAEFQLMPDVMQSALHSEHKAALLCLMVIWY